MVKVSLPRQFMSYTDLIGDFESQGTTIQSVLGELVDTYPFLKVQLYNNDRALRNFVNLFVNEQMEVNLSASIPSCSRIKIIVAVAGG
ncbi:MULTISPECIES: hypothetical protein [Symbiopectobacterium]|uniref:hypothetical protein n=1 Tax=Symbiopectobacterium TaxID=801 RepID=UPI001A241E6B|nr:MULTISPECIES: hypothetical protein [Symbiopectobacterium]MBG6249023.1 hypothetical protein [Candidatus Symbiopectobacterium sp. PLON1]MBT9429173.1 hypothetical protein [Candidatus Symbiopectobacterium endolongispinus]